MFMPVRVIYRILFMSRHLITRKTYLQGRDSSLFQYEKTKQAIWRKNHSACFLCYYICRKVFSQTEQSGRENEKWRTKKALLGLFSFSIEKRFWRRHPDLNWGSRCCRPLPYHLAIAPIGADYEARTRYLHLGKVALYQMS